MFKKIHLNLLRFEAGFIRFGCVFGTRSNIEDGDFAKTVNSWKALTNFKNSSILDVWLGSEYATVVDDNKS